MASRSGVAFSLALAVSVAVQGQIFEDGHEHIVDGPSPAIIVRDSPEGLATTVSVFAPAEVRSSGESVSVSLGSQSVVAGSSHGGHAYCDIFSGKLFGSIVVSSGGRVRIFDGEVGSGFYCISDGPAAARLSPGGGTFGSTGGASGTRAEMTISGGVVNGSASSFPPFSVSADGGALLRVAGGTLVDGILISPGSIAVTTGGSLNDDLSDALGSIPVWSEGVDGDAILHASGGTFTGLGWLFGGSRARISGGEWRFEPSMPPLGFVTNNIRAEGTAARPTVVEIAGGNFHQGLAPGLLGFIDIRENATVHYYLTEPVEACMPLPCGSTLMDGNQPPLPRGPGNYVVHFPVRDTPGLTGGFDLFATEHGALVTVDPDGQGGNPGITVDFEGVPLGTVDFGGNTGPRDTGIADTIVRRAAVQNPKVKPYRVTSPIEIVALQLATKNPIDLRAFGQFGRERLFLTLQSSRQPGEPQGNPSVGFLDVNFAMRDFTATVDLNFDLRAGSLKGPIIFSGQEKLETAYPIPWSTEAPRDAIDISGVNSGFYAGVIAGVAAPMKLESEAFSIGSSSATAPWLEPLITLSRTSIKEKGNGNLVVFVLSSKTFDATTIDPIHTAFGPRGVVEVHGKTHMEDVNGDGRRDAVMHFSLPLTGFTQFHRQACIRGRAQKGTRFRACTAIEVN